MSLSRNSNTITTYQVLLEIAEHLRNLTSDKNALAEASKQAYALPSAEKSKAESARNDILSNNKLLNEINLKTLELRSQEDAAKLSEVANISAIKKLQAKEADLLNRENIIDSALLEQRKNISDIKSREDMLDKKLNDIALQEARLAERKNSVDSYENSLKERAAQLRGITEGL